MTMPDQATSSPCQKIGIARIPSLACSAPHHGSFVKNMSPSRMSSAGQESSTSRTNSSIVAPCCRMYIPQYRPRPSGVTRAALKS
jgi:hypothetical protein